MTRGKKPLNPPAIDIGADASLDQEQISHAAEQARTSAMEEKAEHDAAVFELGVAAGGLQVIRMQAQIFRAAEIKLFEKMKESNKFKYLRLQAADGTFRTAENFKDFCHLYFGVSYSTLAEKSQDLQLLGDTAYDAANRLGLNRSQLRLIRTLPDDQREAVQVALQSESKAEVVAVIEDIAAKLAETNASLAEEKAEREADKALLDTKNKKIDQLQREVRRIAKLPPDEELTATMKEATAVTMDALGAIRGGVRHALIAIKNASADDQTVVMAGLLGQLQAELSLLREEFNLPDVSSAAEQQLASEVAQWGQ